MIGVTQAVDRHRGLSVRLPGEHRALADRRDPGRSAANRWEIALASAFGLVGWFGVDYVLRDGNPWPVEINPRYTASLEIHELASGRSLLAEHRRACEGDAASSATPGSSRSAAIAR